MNMQMAKPVAATATAVLMTLVLAACNKTQPAPMAPTTSTQSPAVTMADGESADVVVTTKVKTALLAAADVKSFDISVVTTKGDVRLGGVVDNQAQIDSAVRTVRAVEGVQSVRDELTLKK
jgi:hyperosmotically inducible protein